MPWCTLRPICESKHTVTAAEHVASRDFGTERTPAGTRMLPTKPVMEAWLRLSVDLWQQA